MQKKNCFVFLCALVWYTLVGFVMFQLDTCCMHWAVMSDFRFKGVSLWVTVITVAILRLVNSINAEWQLINFQCLSVVFVYKLPNLNVCKFVNDVHRWAELLRPIRGPLCFYALHEWPSWGSSVNRLSALHRENCVCGVLVKAWENEMRGSLWRCSLSDFIMRLRL